jgi:lipid II:glycine glycyltransferase (peptidoglycan interpeptide bridge formation enzyme)
MLSWEEWSGTSEAWDQAIQKFNDYTIYQSYAWGMHKSNFGWMPIRVVCYSASQIRAMAQIFVKKYPISMAVVWIPGGPVGDLSLCGDSLQEFINLKLKVVFVYCRLNSTIQYSPSVHKKLVNFGWKKCRSAMLSGQSLVYRPSENEDFRKKECSRNWRHNLLRSSNRGLNTYLWQDPDPQEIMLVYDEMQKYKQLIPQTNLLEIESLINEFGRRLILVRCDNESGELLAFRGSLILGEKAWDIFAATTPDGRKVYASYAAFWELMKQCAKHGVQWYDLGGADPINNPGVYDFKKGVGSKDFYYLGEWEYAKPYFFRSIISNLIAWQNRK